jgi:hypothetical protein
VPIVKACVAHESRKRIAACFCTNWTNVTDQSAAMLCCSSLSTGNVHRTFTLLRIQVRSPGRLVKIRLLRRLKTERQRRQSIATMSATTMLVTLMTPLVVHVEHDELSNSKTCNLGYCVCAHARMCVCVCQCLCIVCVCVCNMMSMKHIGAV